MRNLADTVGVARGFLSRFERVAVEGHEGEEGSRTGTGTGTGTDTIDLPNQSPDQSMV
jgi:hypothetical protein